MNHDIVEIACDEVTRLRRRVDELKQDATRILAQRDRLEKALRFIAANAGDNFIAICAEDALAELDKEKNK